MTDTAKQPCLYCGATILVGMGPRARKFCSPGCKDDWKIQRLSAEHFCAYLARPAQPCTTCGTLFKPTYRASRQLYCSVECGYDSHANRGRVVNTRLQRRNENLARLRQLFQGAPA